MVQPTLNFIDNFDAKLPYTFTYTYWGTELSSVNEVYIREQKANSTAVYDEQITNMDKNHILPADTLQNGVSYIAKIRVKLTDGWSDWSPEVKFMCLATPNIVFNSIDDKNFVYNNELLMTATYRQEQGEKVTQFQYTLLDQRRVPITEYPVRLPDHNTPNILTEKFSGLVKGTLYYVQLTVHTAHGIIYTAEKTFTPQYISPNLAGIIHPTLKEDEGEIVIETFLKQLLPTQVKPYVPNSTTDSDNNYSFWQNDYVIIPETMPLMYTHLGMAKASDWKAKIWCQNIKNGEFLELSPELGLGQHISFFKHDDYITAEKTQGHIKARYRSNIVPNLKLGKFYLYIYVHEFRVEMKIVPNVEGGGF